ncbi:hypothetical protein J6590_053841 [Homalodisca vitripennis]|nr:hypothetical protein J6590_053841 [Homalodisca vitripennis]
MFKEEREEVEDDSQNDDIFLWGGEILKVRNCRKWGAATSREVLDAPESEKCQRPESARGRGLVEVVTCYISQAGTCQRQRVSKLSSFKDSLLPEAKTYQWLGQVVIEADGSKKARRNCQMWGGCHRPEDSEGRGLELPKTRNCQMQCAARGSEETQNQRSDIGWKLI